MSSRNKAASATEDENPGGLLGDGLAEGGEFRVRVEGVRSVDYGCHAILCRSFLESSVDGLPIGELEVVGDENVLLGHGMAVAAGRRHCEGEAGESKIRFECLHEGTHSWTVRALRIRASREGLVNGHWVRRITTRPGGEDYTPAFLENANVGNSATGKAEARAKEEADSRGE